METRREIDINIKQLIILRKSRRVPRRICLTINLLHDTIIFICPVHNSSLTPSRADSNDSGDDAASALSLMPDIRVPMFEGLSRLSSLSLRNKTECCGKKGQINERQQTVPGKRTDRSSRGDVIAIPESRFENLDYSRRKSRVLPMPLTFRNNSRRLASGQVTRCANYPPGRLSFKLD